MKELLHPREFYPSPMGELMPRLTFNRTRLSLPAVFALCCAVVWFITGFPSAEAGQPSFPDLVISSVSNPPASAFAATSFSVTDTTGNSGNATASASTTRYYLSLDNVITGADSLLTGSRSVPSLKKNSSSTGSVSVTIPAGQAPGTYYLGACADDTAVISESNESNNCTASTSTIVVSAAATISGLNPSSGAIGTPVTVSGSDFGATQGSSTVTFNGTTATPTNWSDSSITVPVPANASTGPVVVTVSGIASNGVTFTLTYSPRINAGGSSFTDGSSNYWDADRAYGSGPWGYTSGSQFSTGDPIANTNDDALYQSERWDTGFGYKFDLPNGKYDVTLHFAEIWFNSAGQRVFKVLIENSLALDNYDIYAQVGHDVATTKIFYGIDVQDGQLNIDFVSITSNPKISAISVLPARPTKLVITSVNSGNPPTAGVAFPVTIQAQNPAGTPTNATVATNVSLTLKSGGGTLGGTLTGTISAGSNQTTINGPTYSKNDYGVVLTASATSGETLTPGDSASFNVNAGNPTKLGLLFQPANSTTSGAIQGPPTVAVQDDAGNIITTSTAAITIAIGTNPGVGTLTGTTVKNASGGIAGFADLHIDQPANGYTLTATSPGLTGVTTNTYNITAAGSVSGTVTKSAGGGAITGALVEALQSGVVKGGASTNSTGTYTITGLTPGTYDIRGSAGGFTPQTQTGLTVNSGSTTTANFSLAVASPTAGIVYIYDELQRLKSVINPVGEAATYSYDSVGNLLSITRYNGSQTSVIDFNPKSGPVGASVTIYGTGFSATPSQNTVTFNGVGATVISSTLTQIETTVPSGATSGVINVTSPAGSANSSTSFTVTGAPSGAPTITSFTPTIATVGTTITITGTNFDTTPANNEVYFNPTFAPVSGATATSLEVNVPLGAKNGKISVRTAAGTVTSTDNFHLVPAPFTADQVDFLGTATIDGASVTATITNTPNKIALVYFNGNAGQQVGMGLNSFTLPGGTDFNVYNPDGSILLASGVLQNAHWELPMTGTYTILFNAGGATGNVTLTLSEDIDAGSAVIGGASGTVSVNRVGQWARLKFDASANQTVSMGVSAATLPGGTDMYLYRPDGALFQFFQTMSNFRLQLPAVSGTYTLVLNPGGATGNATFTFSEDSDGGTIVIMGSTATITVNRIGQWAKLQFAGTADQTISMGVNSATLPGGTDTYIYQPDGNLFQFVDTLGFRLKLPSQTGTYTILFNPGGATGNATFNLSEDTASAISMTGSSVTLTIDRVGQWGKLTFDGVAGQYVSMGVNSFTLPGGTDTWIYAPDGSFVQFIDTLAGGFHIQLPQQTGTYTILFNPGGNLGNVTATLSEDVDAGTVTINGSAATANITRIGQLARMRFTGTASQQVTLHADSSTLGSLTDVRVYEPDGSTILATHLNFAAGQQLGMTLPDDGEYTVLVIPQGTLTGSITMSVTNP